eukprot:11080493-Heterocapsa_arctica.AAC.1
MPNKLDNIVCYNSDGICKGVVIGGDEYDVIKAVKSGRINKLIVALCVDNCASHFATEVQFGHAGAQACDVTETAAAKSATMKKAGLIVPDQFDEMPEALKSLHTKMVQIEETPEAETPTMKTKFASKSAKD